MPRPSSIVGIVTVNLTANQGDRGYAASVKGAGSPVWQLHDLGVCTARSTSRIRSGTSNRVAVASTRWLSTRRSTLGVGMPSCGPATTPRSRRRSAQDMGRVRYPATYRVICAAPRPAERSARRLNFAMLPEPTSGPTATAMPTTTVNRALLDVAATWKPGAVVPARSIRREADELYEYVSLKTLSTAIRGTRARPSIRPSYWTVTRRPPGALPRTSSTTSSPGTGFPRPLVNHWIQIGDRRLERDFGLSRAGGPRTDSKFHRTQDQIDRDDERDALLQANGWAVVRVTQRRIRREPERWRSAVGRSQPLAGGGCVSPIPGSAQLPLVDGRRRAGQWVATGGRLGKAITSRILSCAAEQRARPGRGRTRSRRAAARRTGAPRAGNRSATRPPPRRSPIASNTCDCTSGVLIRIDPPPTRCRSRRRRTRSAATRPGSGRRRRPAP